jgi:hypothetical protein
MLQHGGKFGLWVTLCCAVPLAALGAVLLFNVPTLPASLVAFAGLSLIAPRLLAVSNRTKRDEEATQMPGPSHR